MRFIIFGFLIFVFYRIGNFIPLPFVLVDGSISELFLNVTKTGVINQQALQRMSLFSLGIVPYITAGIIIQLIKFLFSDTAYGNNLKNKKNISFQTLIFTFIISLLQSFVFSRHILIENDSIFNVFVVVSCLVCGSFITVWFSKLITGLGYGNGASIIIMFSIIEHFFLSGQSLFLNTANGSMTILSFLGCVLYFLFFVFLIAKVELAFRPLNLIYPSKTSKYGYGKVKKSDILPLKINNSGVLPLIFSMSFSALLSIFLAPYVFSNYGIDISIILSFVTLFFVAFFIFFYTPFVLNTEEISHNLKKSSILLENRRPGDITKKYIDSVVYKLNYISVVYLGIMVVIPDILKFNGFPVIISGVSCVILVVVIVDIIKRVQYMKYSHKFKSLVN